MAANRSSIERGHGGDLREGRWMRRACIESGEPCADFVEERSEKESTEGRWALLKAAQGAAEQRARSNKVAVVEMVKSCSDLDEGLEEAFLRLIQFEPCAFPELVSLEEFPGAVAREAFSEQIRGPVEWALGAHSSQFNVHSPESERPHALYEEDNPGAGELPRSRTLQVRNRKDIPDQRVWKGFVTSGRRAQSGERARSWGGRRSASEVRRRHRFAGASTPARFLQIR